MKVVADSNIPGLAEAARTFGAVEFDGCPAAEIDAARVRDAELLFVRSTVRCGPALLAGSRVRFLATATIGTDHLDLPWLAARGIEVASAPGSNADSVVQWLGAALLELDIPLQGRPAGVVGVGNVGGRVARLLEAMGAEVLRCDPPRQRAGLDPFAYHELDDLCRRCELLTLHVPLTHAGADRTVSLIDERRLRLLPARAVLVNAARGEVVDGGALLATRRGGHLGAAALDVFPGEPAPDPGLVAALDLATPHIAGHSLEGKINGTRMVYAAACRFLGVVPSWRPGPELLPPNPTDGRRPDRDSSGRSDEEMLAQLLGYDIRADDRALRRMVALPTAERGAAFRRYRENYPVRRELTGARLFLPGPRPRLQAMLAALGARVSIVV